MARGFQSLGNHIAPRTLHNVQINRVGGDGHTYMSQTAEYSVIHRKAKVARDEFDAREMSPAKALRLSMAKTAESLLQLALVVRTVEQVTVPLQQMESSLGEGGLMIVLDGTDGIRGAAKLDHALVTALIEVQLIGQLRDRMPDPRPFTHTDAAITQPLINEVLNRFHQILSEEDIDSGADGLRFGDMVEDARTLVLGLEAPDFELYRLNADLGPGKRTGLMDIYLPHRPQLPEGGAHGGLDALARKLEKAAMNAPVTLDAALARLRRPLNEVLTWAPGTTLVVDPGMLSDGILLGAGDHEVARFKLGQFEGFRAVQLISDAALEDEPDSEAETAQPAESEGSPAQIAPPTDGEAAALDPTGENALAEIGLDISEPDAEGAAPAGQDDWPALGGLDDVAGDLDDLLQDIPESDLPDELPPDDAADDGDFAPLPMMVADIDLDE